MTIFEAVPVLNGFEAWRLLHTHILRGCATRRMTLRDPALHPTPTMDEEGLIKGYADLMRDLYTPAAYYARVQNYVDHAPKTPGSRKITWGDVKTLFRTIYRVGIKSSSRGEFWRVGLRSLLRTPHTFAWFVAHAVMGEHMIRYTEETVLPRLAEARRDVRDERRIGAERPRRVPEPVPEALVPATRLASKRPRLDGPWLPATTRQHEP